MTARGAAAAAMAALLLPVTALWTARAVCPGDSVQPASGTPRLAGSPPRLCATFSIVAIDTATGEAGVAVQSHWFSVGSMVPWARAGVGAVATQSFVEPAYGPRILDRIEHGERATGALAAETDADSLRSVRQVLAIDMRGNTGAYTGEECIPYAGHRVGKDHACAGNLLAAPGVWDSMSAAFTRTTGPLAERLLAALEAGQAAGGDSRGMQSAALLVERAVDPQRPWKNRIVDLRVEDHPDPIVEIRRLYRIHEAYRLADEGDAAFARKLFADAFRLYDGALRLQPDNDEILFWRASMYAGTGRLEEAASDAAEAIRRNGRWRALLARIPESAFPQAGEVCRRLSIPRVAGR